MTEFEQLSKDLMPEQNPLLSLAYATQKGSSSLMTKINQDRLMIKKKLSGIDNLYMIGVADGHGTNGHLVAQQIKKTIVQILEFEDKRMMQFKSREKEKGTCSIFEGDL